MPSNVNIFIPVYNGQKYLEQTLDSILNQTYRNWELLCVDDTSTDNSHDILNHYSNKDNRIKIFRKENGGSVPPSWLYIFPHLKGEFTLYMSQDDLLEPDLLQSLVQRQRDTNADAVMPTEYAYFENMPREEWPLYGKPELIDKVISGKEAFKLMIDYQIPGFALWRTDIIKQGGMRTDTYNCDELAQRHWVSLCNKVAFSRGVFLWRRGNPQAITRTDTALHYETSFTHALLLQLAEDVLSNEKDFVLGLGNRYFHQLFLAMIDFRKKRNTFSDQERGRIAYCNKQAYRILHGYNSQSNWKYKIGSINFFFINLIVEFKYLQFRVRTISNAFLHTLPLL